MTNFIFVLGHKSWRFFRGFFFTHERFYIILLILLPVGFYWNYLFTLPAPLIFPNSDLGTDLPREVWPLANYVVNAIHESGEIPLWRPYQLSGAPLVGHPTAPIFYPVYWLTLVLPIPLALNLCVVIHIGWMGIGMYLLLRSLNIKPEAAFIGAIVFSQTPKWVAHLGGGHLYMLSAISWWPWVWLGVEKFWKSNNKYWCLLTAVGFCAQAINHGTIFVLSMIGIGLRCMWYFRFNKAWLGKLLSLVVISGMIFLGLGAVQLFPFFELLPLSNRANMSPADASYGSLPPVALFNIIFPPSLKYPELYLYPGAIVVFMAFVQIIRGIKDKRILFWSIMALIGIFMSLGSYTPLYQIFMKVFPTLSIMRIPTRWWIFTIFALSILCAYYVEAWQNRAYISNKAINLTGTIFITMYAVTAIASIVIPFPFIVIPSFITLLLGFILLLGKPAKIKYGLLCLLIIIDLWIVGKNQIVPKQENDIARANPLIEAISNSIGATGRVFSPYGGLGASDLVKYRLNTADGYDSFQLDRYSRLVNDAIGCEYSDYSVSVPSVQTSPEALKQCPTFLPNIPIYRLLNIRYMILPKKIDHFPYTKITEYEDYALYDIGGGLGRAFGVETVNTRQTTACEKELTTLNLQDAALLDENPTNFTQSFRRMDVLKAEKIANREKFTVNVYEPSLLVRSETWAPGWHAYAQGKQIDVMRVDCALQGVWLDQGNSEVVFIYEPLGYSIGKWVSLITFCFILCILGSMMSKRINHRSKKIVS